jgi:hypothetical protein
MRKLFLLLRENITAIKSTISGWVRQVIRTAYRGPKKEDSLPNADLRAHPTRGVVSSWALLSGVSIADIMDAAGLKRNRTFVSHYLRSLALAKGSFPVVVVTATTASYGCILFHI